MAFEIGPRTNEQTFEGPSRGKHPAYQGQMHSRVINGTEYVFGRFTYETGETAVQAIARGQSTKEKPDVHYWTDIKEPEPGA
ncbi:hypothetical protein ACFYWP_01515 [Actinacidiphila glaucinigra]|uniref:hypothetical protein n=1 Tax=Actinacidiphila glaucinigra TaxID=235986 RepID=UPI00368479DF